MTDKRLAAWAWLLLYAGCICLFAEGVIDNARIDAVLVGNYLPHALAARIIAVPAAALWLAATIIWTIIWIRAAARWMTGRR